MNNNPKIVVLPPNERAESEMNIERATRELIATLAQISYAGKLIGEGDLSAKLLIELYSLISKCYRASSTPHVKPTCNI